MRIGYRHWGWVTTDSAGVPHGGRFGDVGRFERGANGHGLIVGWSRRLNCFGVCTRRGPTKWVCQLVLRNSKGIVPFSDSVLWLLLFAWERHARLTESTITEYLRDVQRKERAAVAKEIYDEQALRVKDSVQESFYRQGIETRRLISIPGRLN